MASGGDNRYGSEINVDGQFPLRTESYSADQNVSEINVDGQCPLRTESYSVQKADHWPAQGRHILAQFDDDTIVVYQAFCPEIADYAVQHQQFRGIFNYSLL